MSDVVSVGRRVSSVDVTPQFQPYSKVIIHVSDDSAIEVGNDTGKTFEIDNPFGTQQMAQNILNSLSGFQYQPYTADGAHLDPAAEIGDAANIRGAYGGIYNRKKNFGRLMKAEISAPQDEEIDNEYKYQSPTERKFTRQINDVKASLIIANDKIDAKVEQTGGSQSSFGWTLTSDAHKWYANGREVMSVTASGLKVTGEVQATSGKIGNFNIGASAIWNNISSFGGNQSSGVYIGTNGIQLGQSFKVTSTGAVTATNISANNMTLTGTLNIGGSTITAEALRSGAQSAYSTGSYWSGGAAGGYSAKGLWDNAQNQNIGVNYIRVSTLVVPNVFTFGGTAIRKLTATVNGVKYKYLAWGMPE